MREFLRMSVHAAIVHFSTLLVSLQSVVSRRGGVFLIDSSHARATQTISLTFHSNSGWRCRWHRSRCRILWNERPAATEVVESTAVSELAGQCFHYAETHQIYPKAGFRVGRRTARSSASLLYHNCKPATMIDSDLSRKQ